MATKTSILWIDDEIEMFGGHQMFLKGKGYTLETATNGYDALNLLEHTNYDIIFLDENMPGISGLDTLLEIKKIKPDIPVVMVTKNEEEHIMEQAIGSKIADYIIKPVNPSQLLLCIKKHTQSTELWAYHWTCNRSSVYPTRITSVSRILCLVGDDCRSVFKCGSCWLSARGADNTHTLDGRELWQTNMQLPPTRTIDRMDETR